MSKRADAECALLRLLIIRLPADSGDGGPPSATSRLNPVFEQLDGYRWGDEEHRVVYECLRFTVRVPGARLREEMAAEATRRGHPDVDWDVYFGAPAEGGDFADILRSLTSCDDTPDQTSGANDA